MFEKSRITKADEILKNKILETYNTKLDGFSTSYIKENEFSIVGDLLLDLFRHKQGAIIDVKAAS